jgi:putative oxidoreductase
MQRLFSTFPNSLPGCGLLLLRITAGLSLLTQLSSVVATSITLTSAIYLAIILVGSLLVIGFCTPYAAAAQVAIQIVGMLAASRFDQAHLALTCIGVSLILLGPGSWSVDARLYGRRRIDLNSPKL